MNKGEFLAEIMRKNERDIASKAGCERIVQSVFDTIMEAVAKGDSVAIAGFGAFTSVKHGERLGRNPKTGEEVKVAARVIPKFRPGSDFKNRVK